MRPAPRRVHRSGMRLGFAGRIESAAWGPFEGFELGGGAAGRGGLPNPISLLTRRGNASGVDDGRPVAGDQGRPKPSIIQLDHCIPQMRDGGACDLHLICHESQTSLAEGKRRYKLQGNRNPWRSTVRKNCAIAKNLLGRLTGAVTATANHCVGGPAGEIFLSSAVTKRMAGARQARSFSRQIC